MRRRRLALVAFTLVLTACGSDGRDAGLAEYCERMAASIQGPPVLDLTDPQSQVDFFAERARLDRAVADIAPEAVRAAHELIADADEALAAEIEKRQPKVIEEVAAIVTEVTIEFEAEFGDLAPAHAKIEAFAEKECGLTFPEPG